MGFTLSVWMRGRTVSLLCKSRNVFHWAVTSAYTLNRLFHISKSEKQPMLYVIHVSERQKKCLFFPTWSFIGMFRSLHWNKGESCFCLRYPSSPSLNLRMFYPPVWLLFEIPVPPPHVWPHGVPQQFLLNKLAKNHVPGLLVFFWPSYAVVQAVQQLVGSLAFCYHHRLTKAPETQQVVVNHRLDKHP